MRTRVETLEAKFKIYTVRLKAYEAENSMRADSSE